jgi:hypothetical protein
MKVLLDANISWKLVKILKPAFDDCAHGLGLTMVSPDGGDAIIGFHFNPYLQVGQEWGPTFYAGVKVYTFGKWDGADKAIINFEVPICLQVSF